MTLLLPYRVQSPPVTLTSTSAKKVTFTQTRVHKYLSERTQMDDIFQGSSLYATSQLKLLHEDKERQLLLLAFGGAGTPPAYLAEERTGLCDKDTYRGGTGENSSWAAAAPAAANKPTLFRSSTWLLKKKQRSELILTLATLKSALLQHLQARLESADLSIIDQILNQHRHKLL